VTLCPECARLHYEVRSIVLVRKCVCADALVRLWVHYANAFDRNVHYDRSL
jgi:hypothetical protein